MSDQKSQARNTLIAGVGEGNYLKPNSIANHRQRFDLAFELFSIQLLRHIEANCPQIKPEVANLHFIDRIKATAKARKFNFVSGDIATGISILCYSQFKTKKTLVAVNNHLAEKTGAK